MEDFREAVPEPGQEFVVDQQKHGDQCNPDLCEHGVFAGSEECFDLEVLLDPFEEQLYLPTFPIDICNCPR